MTTMIPDLVVGSVSFAPSPGADADAADLRADQVIRPVGPERVAADRLHQRVARRVRGAFLVTALGGDRFLEVVAGAEMFPVRGQHHDPHIRVIRDLP